MILDPIKAVAKMIAARKTVSGDEIIAFQSMAGVSELDAIRNVSVANKIALAYKTDGYIDQQEFDRITANHGGNFVPSLLKELNAFVENNGERFNFYRQFNIRTSDSHYYYPRLIMFSRKAIQGMLSCKELYFETHDVAIDETTDLFNSDEDIYLAFHRGSLDKAKYWIYVLKRRNDDGTYAVQIDGLCECKRKELIDYLEKYHIEVALTM